MRFIRQSYQKDKPMTILAGILFVMMIATSILAIVSFSSKPQTTAQANDQCVDDQFVAHSESSHVQAAGPNINLAAVQYMYMPNGAYKPEKGKPAVWIQGDARFAEILKACDVPYVIGGNRVVVPLSFMKTMFEQNFAIYRPRLDTVQLAPEALASFGVPAEDEDGSKFVYRIVTSE